jgi:hypothetical protein
MRIVALASGGDVQNRAGGRSTGVLDYSRHFVLLACVSAALVASSRWRPALGAVASFGIYGALHASVVVVTLRTSPPPWRKLLIVAAGTILSMLSVTLSLYASRFHAALPGMAKPALLLALSSSFGAACYAALLRRAVGVQLRPSALVSIPLGCVVAVLAILESGVYLRSGGLGFALAWWFAFSLGLWLHDRGATAGA